MALRQGREWRLAVLVTVVLAGCVWCGALPGRAADDKEKADAAAADAVKKEEAATKQREEAMRKALEEAQNAYEQQQRELKERLRTDPMWQPSHEQVRVIKVNEGEPARAIESFCLDKEGRLLVCCVPNARPDDQDDSQADAKKDANQGEILVISREGKKLDAWKMPFPPQAICAAGDGTIFVGGAGRLCQLDKNGKVLRSGEAPNAAGLPPIPEPEKEPELTGPAAEAAEAARQREIAELEKQSAELEKELEKISQEAEEGGKASEDEALQEKIRQPLARLQAVQTKLELLQLSRKDRIARLRQQRDFQLTLSGLAASGDDLFVSCRAAQGYGFVVWRIDRKFGNPKQVVENLLGCCSQMDIQSDGGQLWVAHNAKHRVERYDRDGKNLGSFGKEDEMSADGFGGCCEPKNLRFTAGGEILAAESGPPTCVKRFSKEGKFLGVALIAPWDSGCVRVTTELDEEGSFYVLNTDENSIHVFAKKANAAAADAAK